MSEEKKGITFDKADKYIGIAILILAVVILITSTLMNIAEKQYHASLTPQEWKLRWF